MIELTSYMKVVKEKNGEKIIKDYSHKKKICGYVDGWRFLTRKKKLLGVIEKTDDENYITKYEWGLTCLKLNQKKEILDEEENFLGYFKNYKIHYPNGEVYVEYLEDKNEIQRFRKKTIRRLATYVIIELKGDLTDFNEIIFFGIANFFLEIFA